MSDYEVSVNGGVNDTEVPLHGHLDISIVQSEIVANPEGEATDILEKVKIDDTIYETLPGMPEQSGYYTLDIHIGDDEKELYWRRLAIPSNALYPSDVQ